ncbi:hypothetical protein J5N97_027687 [Dioscorea zingiberensis]|uniref:RING-type domain-containing protein n=1 Tax=Dioscorea zingiberensis TaxID=325984 RepID=A0A9D5H408_9LILI|nr:hypothetical protein J5N97_027687 [Dioscorea zingiberensis]
MGANCCVAARDKPLPYQTSLEVPIRRNVRHSPSWSFRWDNRTHIEDIMDNSTHFSRHNSGNIGSEIKSGEETETEGFSDGGSPLDAFRMSRWRKSAVKTGTSGHVKVGGSDLSTESNLSVEDKYCTKSSDVASASDTKPSLYTPSTPSPSAHRPDPSSSRSRSLPSEPTSSRKIRGSPGYQLSRQVSDSRIPALKSLNENSSPEDRQSFVLSMCSNDLSTGGSQGGSSDGWSMRMFSELVASSQRERWSFDSENPSSNSIKVARSNNQTSTSLSTELQTCGVCQKLLKDRSPWTVQKLVASNEVAVVAVLVCGHVYHAECLESLTPEADRYDPSCPVCTHGEKYGSKLLSKVESKARNKISRIAVADGDVDADRIPQRQKSGKFPRLGASASMKSAFSRPFLRRHFSIGPRPPVRSASESESSSRKKGFWARYRRD